jgi:tetratricopeptide (TPR) repeat protein
VGDFIVAATRQGAVYVIPWRVADAVTETPQTYTSQGEWEKAAIAYTLQGNYVQAAGVYADQLGQPLQAGQLYFHAGEYQRVVGLLGQSTDEAERVLARQAVQAIPAGKERAQALYEIAEFLDAANIYAQMGEFEKAGDCYVEAQEWERAQKAYAEAAAWDKWDKVTREHELWQAVVDRYVEAGDYAQAAEIQSERGQFLEAAIYFDRAGLAAEALNAYQWVDPRNLTGEAQQRMLELAEQLGEFEVTFKIYKAQGRLEKAAELAESAGHYNHAIELYRELGEFRKAAEILEKQSRYTEAAGLYERARHWGRAAESLEKHVEQEVERTGGIRYLQDTEPLENHLKRAIEMYEEEADYAGETARQALFEGADRCRVSLMSLRREPLLRLSLKADRLVYNQGNAIHYTVENVGWGTARNLVLLISGNNLMEEEKFELGALGRRQKTEGVATVVPTLVGEIMLQVQLLGQSKNGELRESLTQPLQVAPMPASGGAGVSLDAQVGHGAAGLRNLQAPIADRGSIWSEGTNPTATGPLEAPITPEQLKRQRIDSLRRQLAKHYSVLNILEEQSADYPAGQAPVELQVRINNTQEKIDEIETTLEELESD